MASSNEPNLTEFPIDKEFLKVSSKVPTLPLDREMKFTIDLVLSTTLISWAPYEMGLLKLAGLKIQL